MTTTRERASVFVSQHFWTQSTDRIDAVESLIISVRDEALEEAAQLADAATGYISSEKIRALKSKPQPQER